MKIISMTRLPFVAALTGMALLAASGARAEDPGFLRGSWVLEQAYEIKPDGTLAHPYGATPQGVLFVDGQGRYAVEIYGDSRAKFPSAGPTPDDYKAAFTSMSVHMGTVETDTANGLLIFHVQHNGNPDRDQTVQKRPYELDGDVLTYKVPAAAEGKINTPVSVWRRADAAPREIGRDRPRRDKSDY